MLNLNCKIGTSFPIISREIALADAIGNEVENAVRRKTLAKGFMSSGNSQRLINKTVLSHLDKIGSMHLSEVVSVAESVCKLSPSAIKRAIYKVPGVTRDYGMWSAAQKSLF